MYYLYMNNFVRSLAEIEQALTLRIRITRTYLRPPAAGFIAALDKKATPVFYDHVYRALSLAELGDAEQVNTERARVLGINPDYSAERSISDIGSYNRDTELNLFLDSHRKAGLPLCATEAQLAKYPDMKRLEQCEAQRASG